MNYPALLLALFLDRVFPDLLGQRDFSWLRSYFGSVRKHLKSFPQKYQPWVFPGSVLPLLAIIAWVQFSLGPELGRLFDFIFSCAALYLCFGPEEPFDTATQAMTSGAHRETSGAAQLTPREAPARGATGQSEEENCGAVFNAFNERFFGPICWFALLGPIGAVTYRLLERLRSVAATDSDRGSAAILRTFQWVNWLPARFCATGFAIAGDFEATTKAWRNHHALGSEALIRVTGWAAMNDSSGRFRTRVEEAVALGWRTLKAWVGILGIAFLLGLA